MGRMDSREASFLIPTSFTSINVQELDDSDTSLGHVIYNLLTHLTLSQNLGNAFPLSSLKVEEGRGVSFSTTTTLFKICTVYGIK